MIFIVTFKVTIVNQAVTVKNSALFPQLPTITASGRVRFTHQLTAAGSLTPNKAVIPGTKNNSYPFRIILSTGA